MNELWKEIEGYDGDYLVSNFGRVISFKNNKRIYLKPNKSRRYYVVSLSKNKTSKTFLLHRLVANAFIPNPENKPEVNHINGLKTDNNLTNLEWATRKRNMQHAWQNGLMKNSRKNIIIAQEARKKQIFSSKLNMYFESTVEAATYIQTHYFENVTLGCLKTSINLLLNNKVTKSKFDFGWKYN